MPVKATCLCRLIPGDTRVASAQELIHLLDQSPPPIGRIEAALKSINPAELATVIQRGPALAYQIDYYFRLLPENIALRFIESAEFDAEARIRLFNCQLARYYATAGRKGGQRAPAALIQSYWGFLTESTFVDLITQLWNNQRIEDIDAYEWLKFVDQACLSALLESAEFDRQRALHFFRALSDAQIAELGARIDFFDFVYRLARSEEDSEFLARLDIYADRIIQLRAARAIATEVSQKLDPKGHVPLQVVARLIENSADESFRMAIALLEERGAIEAATVRALEKLQESPPAR